MKLWEAATACTAAVRSRLTHVCTSAVVQLAPWKLEADDTKLLDLLPFLEAVVRTAVPDVRVVVRSYEGQDIPTAFRCGASPTTFMTCTGSARSCADVRGGRERPADEHVPPIVVELTGRLLFCRERMARVQALKQQSRGFLSGLSR